MLKNQLLEIGSVGFSPKDPTIILLFGKRFELFSMDKPLITEVILTCIFWVGSSDDSAKHITFKSILDPSKIVPLIPLHPKNWVKDFDVYVITSKVVSL